MLRIFINLESAVGARIINISKCKVLNMLANIVRMYPNYNNLSMSFPSRSRHPELFCKQDVLKNFTEKHLCRSLF